MLVAIASGGATQQIPPADGEGAGHVEPDGHREVCNGIAVEIANE